MRRLACFCALCLAPLATAQPVDPFAVIASPAPDFFEGFGAWVDAVGDVNQDGAVDLVVSAPLAGDYSGGLVYLVASSGEIVSQVGSPNARREGLFGASAAFLGDLNGDNRREALVGAPGETAADRAAFEFGGDGRAYVLAGGSGDVLFSLVSPNADTLGGTYLTGGFGAATAGPGDLTGDGVPDFVVGAPEESSGLLYAGRAYVYSGADGTLVRTLVSPDPQESGLFGARVEPVSDLDADGVSELLVVALRERPSPGSAELGRVHVFSGATGALLFTLDSGIPNSLSTPTGDLADLGDLDGDGTVDIAVGATNVGDNGVVLVFSGATGALVRTLEVDLGEPADAQFGQAIVPLGDVDLDGVPDLFVGAPFANDQGTRAGRAFLISGATGETLLALSSTHPRLNGQFGRTVAWADIDGDGANDPVVGAPFERLVAAEPLGGLVYLFTQAEMRRALGVAVGTDGAAASGPLALGAPRPHPTSGRTTLELRLGAAGPVHAELLDALGRRVAVLADGAFAAGAHAVELDASGLAPGLYLVRARAAGGSVSRRVVVR